MSDDATIQAIQERMRQVRRELSQDLATSARDITDWRSYVRATPWLAIATAVAAGYLLAPKGPRVVRLSGIDLQKLDRDGLTTAVANVPRTKNSLTRTVISSLAGLAARSAMAYVTQRLTNTKAQHAEQSPF